MPRSGGYHPLRYWLPLLAGGLLLAGTTILLRTYSLTRYVDRSVDLGRIAGYERADAALFTVAIFLLFGGYMLMLFLTRKAADTCPKPILLVLVLMTCMLLFGFAMIYPATASDVYLYIVRARLWTEYGVDPSAVRPADVMLDDPFAHFMNWQWAVRVSPYGPLWNWIALPGAWISSSSMLAAVLSFKVLATSALLVSAGLVHQMIRPRGHHLATLATLALILNPLVLWEGIGNAHNDLIALAPLLAALACWQSRRSVWVIPLVTTSILLKYTAAPLLPLVAIALWRTTDPTARFSLALRSGLITLVVTVASLAPFFHLEALWQAIGEQRSIMVTSPALVAYLASEEWQWGISKDALSTLSTVCVGLATLGGCATVWRNPAKLFASCYWVMLVLLLVGTPNLRPWYVVWLLPLALLAGSPGSWLPALVWSFTALWSYGYYIWIRDWWHVSTWVFESTGVASTLLPVIATQVAVSWRFRHPEPPIGRRLQGKVVSEATGYVSPR